MRMRTFPAPIVSVFFAAGLFTVTPASAQTPFSETITPDYLIEVMAQHGMSAEFVEIDNAQGPVLAGDTGSYEFLVTFEACNGSGEDCEIVAFSCGLAMDPAEQPDHEDINLWNRERWGKAYLDDEGDPWIRLELNIVGGMSEDNLSDTLAWWDYLIPEFADFVGF